MEIPHFRETISTVDSSTIDLASSEGLDGMKVFNMKPQVDRFVFPDVLRVLVLASGQLLNLELRHWRIIPS